MNEKKQKKTALWLCTTAMFMAMNIALSSFGVPVPGGHLYLNDVVICLAAMLMVDKEADNKQHTKTTAPRYSEAWKHGRNVHSFMLLYT